MYAVRLWQREKAQKLMLSTPEGEGSEFEGEKMYFRPKRKITADKLVLGE